MATAVKIAISLPESLLRQLERERQAVGESRSEFVRNAIVGRLREQALRDSVEQYVRAYQEQPESEPEIAAALALGAEVLAEEPWE